MHVTLLQAVYPMMWWRQGAMAIPLLKFSLDNVYRKDSHWLLGYA